MLEYNPEDLKKQLGRAVKTDFELLERLRGDARSLKGGEAALHPYSSTTVSLVAADGGDNALIFDPFELLITRVADSYGEELFFDIVTPRDDLNRINARHFEENTALGRLMQDLEVKALWELSPMIPSPDTPPEKRPRSWVKDYRDLGEWAALYDFLIRHDFASDTLVVRDGFLRSKKFAGDYFPRMWDKIRDRLQDVQRKRHRKVYVLGVAKKSKVLQRYQLAFMLEGVLMNEGPRYLPIPPEIERSVYRWQEYAPDEGGGESESKKFVQGRLFLVKFSPNKYGPIYAVDVWQEHVNRGEVDRALGYLLRDAQEGFPQPYYPLCLQRAHEHAHLGQFEMKVMDSFMRDAIATRLPESLRDAPDALAFALEEWNERTSG